MQKCFQFIIILLLSYPVFGQDPELQKLIQEKEQLEKQQLAVEEKIEDRKLVLLQVDLKSKGLPAVLAGEEVVMHQAMALVYDEPREQAKWVAHIIEPEIVDGRITRSNDFRPDPMIKTGSTDEIDYFKKTDKGNGEFDYDGYGYDRGHLAPSADFRWSAKALSESYFYSNMSPQLPDFNRDLWASLEGNIRAYINRYPETRLYVVTGPVFGENPKKVERSPNGVAIPDAFFKVVVDLEHQRAIGFLVPHQNSKAALKSFAKSIDEIELATGIDFFASLEDGLESSLEAQNKVDEWLPDEAKGNVDPLYPPSLPKKHFNTTQAKIYMDKNDEVTICGTVVGARTSKSGNILLNIDQQYPNQVFTIFIRKEDIPNFSYNPEEFWKDKVIAVTGNVIGLGGTPAMFIEKESVLREFKQNAP